MLTRSQARAASSSRAKQPTLKGPPSLSSVTSIPPFQGSVFLPSNLLPPRNRDAYHSSPPHHETGMAADRSERAARGQVVRQANDLADRLLTRLDAAMQDKQSAAELVVSLLQEKTLMKSSLQEMQVDFPLGWQKCESNDSNSVEKRNRRRRNLLPPRNRDALFIASA